MLRTAITQTTRTVARATVATAPQAERTFVTTTVCQKTVTESVKETADKVNRKVGSGLADAIEVGEQVTESVKQTVGIGAEKVNQETNAASAKAAEAASTVKQKGAEAGEAIKQNTRQASAAAKEKANEAAQNVNNRRGV